MLSRDVGERILMKDGSEEKFESMFLGSSEAARKVRKAIVRVARVDSTILILGESGVGKELVAREIHTRSARRLGPFVPVNCAAIPEPLIESELFGFEQGAFTDARGERRGAFELAAEGVLFLDEVGDLSGVAQPKILRAMESGTIQRIGGETERQVDLRIIAATNQDLREMSQTGTFRKELYFRLRILEIRVPPLRERPEDIPELANHFAKGLAESQQRPFAAIDDKALDLLMSYSWPGNVRELKSALERAMAMNSGMVLDAGCFQLDFYTGGGGSSLRDLLESDWKTAHTRFEKTYVTRLMRAHGGNVRAAARAAGLATRSLYKILDRLGLEKSSPEN